MESTDQVALMHLSFSPCHTISSFQYATIRFCNHGSSNRGYTAGYWWSRPSRSSPHAPRERGRKSLYFHAEHPLQSSYSWAAEGGGCGESPAFSLYNHHAELWGEKTFLAIKVLWHICMDNRSIRMSPWLTSLFVGHEELVLSFLGALSGNGPFQDFWV